MTPWRKVERYVSVYPRTNLCGIAAWYCVGGVIEGVALASLPLPAISEIIRRYGPDSLIVESHRVDGWKAGVLEIEGVDSLWYANPRKRGVVTRVPPGAFVGRVPPLVDKAFALGFNALMGRGGFRLHGKLSMRELSPEWLNEFAKHRS